MHTNSICDICIGGMVTEHHIFFRYPPWFRSRSQEKRNVNRYIDSCRDGTRLTTVCSKVISSYKCVFKCGISFGRRRTKSFDFGFGLKIFLSILSECFFFLFFSFTPGDSIRDLYHACLVTGCRSDLHTALARFGGLLELLAGTTCRCFPSVHTFDSQFPTIT